MLESKAEQLGLVAGGGGVSTGGNSRKYYVATGPSWIKPRVPHCAHPITPQPLVLGGKRMRLGLHHCGAARGFWKTLNGAQSHTRWAFSTACEDRGGCLPGWPDHLSSDSSPA